MEKLWLFGLNSGDKGDNIDMWMIKITIKANQIDMDVLLISKVGNTKSMFVPKVRLFSIILLVCEFHPHRQTWYQKFLGLIRPWYEQCSHVEFRDIDLDVEVLR